MVEHSRLLSAIEAIRSRSNGPIRLLSQLRLEYDEVDTNFDGAAVENEVWDIIESAPQNHDIIQRFGLMLRTFDAVGTIEPWVNGTANNTEERRELVYKKLGIPESVAKRMDHDHQFMEVERPILIADEHEEWYTSERKRARGVYWRHLHELLRLQWNDDNNLGLLERDQNRSFDLHKLMVWLASCWFWARLSISGGLRHYTIGAALTVTNTISVSMLVRLK